MHLHLGALLISNVDTIVVAKMYLGVICFKNYAHQSCRMDVRDTVGVCMDTLTGKTSRQELVLPSSL